MSSLHEYLAQQVLITDGAMGTYYTQLSGQGAAFPELANLTEPALIEQIHREYIAAGAKCIRTNTFSANTVSLQISRDELGTVVKAACELAGRAAADRDIFVAADIGPIPEFAEDGRDVERSAVLEEYRYIVDQFFAAGLSLFVFETFSSMDYLHEMAAYIKERQPDAFVLTQFATTPEGYTRKVISNARVIREAKADPAIDAYGFNCGVGPAHMYTLLRHMDFGLDIVSALPNAGYPEVRNERMVYSPNPEYFADRMKQLRELGVRILGGCCGTTPQHIRQLAAMLGRGGEDRVAPEPVAAKAAGAAAKSVVNRFADKLERGEFVLAVELDPPFDTGMDKLMHGAQVCRGQGIDLITIADSPMARARADSVMLAAKLKRDVDIDVMPHVCCRDKNINALKSGLLAGHIENLRNVLAVTGDPIDSADKNDIKHVFNVNSLRLIELIHALNCDVFAGAPYSIGAALNLNMANRDAEYNRMLKKAERGAGFFLTQPLFSEEAIRYLAQMERPGQVRILGGVMPVVSYRNAQFLNHEMPGIHIPEAYVAKFDSEMSREEAEARGIELAVELAVRIRPYVDGFYFITPFNRIGVIVSIIDVLRQSGVI